MCFLKNNIALQVQKPTELLHNADQYDQVQFLICRKSLIPWRILCYCTGAEEKVSVADKILWRVHIQTSGYRKGRQAVQKTCKENHMQDDPR